MDIEAAIGELNGLLRGFAPALERIQEQLRDLSKEGTTNAAELVGLRRDFDEFLDRYEGHKKILYDLRDQARDRERRVQVIEQEREQEKAEAKKRQEEKRVSWPPLLANALVALVSSVLTTGLAFLLFKVRP